MDDADSSHHQGWSNLPTDLLEIVFKKLSLEEMATGAPLCCSSWYRAFKHASGLLKDAQIDLAFMRARPIEAKNKAIDFIVHHSQACLTSINFAPDDIHAVDLLLYLSMSSPVLKNFHLEDNSVQTDERKRTIKKFSLAISRLREVEGMTVNKNLICYYSLKRICRYCPNFTTLEVVDEEAWIVHYVVSKIIPKVVVKGSRSNEDDSNSTAIPKNNASSVLGFWTHCSLEIV